MSRLSVAVVNAYRRFAGSTIAARDYYNAFEDLGYTPHWYQCIDVSDKSEYGRDGHMVQGVPSPFKSLNIAVNRLVIFPYKLRGLGESVVLATDPVLLRLAEHRRNCIVVFHDLRELDGHPTNAGGPILFKLLLPKARAARGLISVSEFTKRQIEARLTDSPEIAVIHRSTRLNGNPTAHIRDSLQRLSENQRLEVLYVAADRPYKNMGFLFDLARRMGRSKSTTFAFRVLSRLGPRTLQQLRRNPIPNLSVDSSVEDIADAFRRADILAFPSLYEGFGLPLIEAMQFGLPLLANSLEPMREIVGDGGILLPANDLDAWTEALNRLAEPGSYEAWAKRSADRGVHFRHDVFKARLSSVMSRWGFSPEQADG